LLLLPPRRNPLPRSSPRPSPPAPRTGEEAQGRGGHTVWESVV
jgi:hypothetical protein